MAQIDTRIKNHAHGCGAMYCPHEADPLSTSALEVGGDPMHSDPRAQSTDDQADLRARVHNVGRPSNPVRGTR